MTRVVIVGGGPGGYEAALVAAQLGAQDRIKRLATAQSLDIQARLEGEGVEVVRGFGHLAGPATVVAETLEGTRTFPADAILISTGARPRVLPGAEPDGERILTWEQVYDLDRAARAAHRRRFRRHRRRVRLGVPRPRVRGRARVVARPGAPGEDPDAAQVLEDVFRRRGMHGAVAQPRASPRVARATASS
jgi:hypothetical protein